MGAVNTLELTVALLLAVLFFAGPWQEYWIAVGRESLFRLRDKLFLMAARGEIGFDSEVYRLMREQLNGMIRFAHGLNLSTMVMLAWRLRTQPEMLRPPVAEAISRVEDKELRSQLNAIMKKAVVAQLAVVVLRSPLGLLLLFAALPAYLWERSRANKRDTWVAQTFATMGTATELESTLEPPARMAA